MKGPVLAWMLAGFLGIGSVAAERPNILFLLADDQRPDTVGALGNPRIRTPNLDELASRGFAASRATCSYPICLVSRAELLTGRPCWSTGIDGLGGRSFQAGLTFWPEAFRKAGYRTATVGKWHVTGRPGAVGFAESHGLFGGGGGRWWKDQFDWKGMAVTGYRGWVFQSADGKTKFPERGIGLRPEIDADFADAAIGFLRTTAGEERPWFLHVNFTAPHDPLFLPPGFEDAYKAADMQVPANFLPQHPFEHGNLKGRDEVLLPFPRTRDDVRKLLRVYYAVISHLDKQVGRIVAELERSGELDNTFVIYTSDHGMAVGSHGLRGKQNMYEHTINVPFLMAGPGIPPGRRSDAQLYLRDLFPTTCELAGIPIPASVTAKSFAGVARGHSEVHHEEIFGCFRDTQRLIRTDRWKFVVYPQVGREQLFDLQNDPLEMKNRSADPSLAGVRTRLAARLAAWRRQQNDPLLAGD